jgi:hypothetical protein
MSVQPCSSFFLFLIFSACVLRASASAVRLQQILTPRISGGSLPSRFRRVTESSILMKINLLKSSGLCSPAVAMARLVRFLCSRNHGWAAAFALLACAIGQGSLHAQTPVVTATTTDNLAVINSSDYATNQISRTGSTSSPLTVYYFWMGTATTWDDYRFLDDTTPDHVTIPAGQSSLTLTFKATGVNDAGEPETAGIQIVDRTGYVHGSPDTAMFNIYTSDPGQQQAGTPTFNPPAGNYPSSQSVTISTPTSGATIYYTLDGSAPTTSSTVYSSPVTLSSSTTLKAIATAPGYSTSAVGSANYTFGSPSNSIAEVRTAAPTVIVVIVQTPITYELGDSNSSSDAIDVTPADWHVDGAQPAAIHRCSIPWDELPALPWNDPNHPNSYPVTTRHRIYLELNTALAEGHTYNITTPYGNTSLTFGARSSFCESIKVNQVGYSKLSTSRFAQLRRVYGRRWDKNL